MAIVLQESLRGLFYAPYYAALALGAYDKEDVEVRFVSAASPDAGPNALFDGTVDVSWGGPMRVNQLHDTRADCDLVCFGEAVTRDPFLLVGRTPRPNPVSGPLPLPPPLAGEGGRRGSGDGWGQLFAELMKVRVATVSEVPTPWLCLQEDLRRAGLDPAKLDCVADRSMAENMAALRLGQIDIVQLFQPLAEELIAEGTGHLWYAAADRGPCSYTTFYARRGVLTTKRDEMASLVRGLYRTQKWLHRATIEALAETVQPYFPAVSRDLLSAALARYRALGIWSKTPTLPRDGYERLKASLVSGGFVRSGTPYEIAVDNSLAEAAVRADPPSL
jgi:NitT/TauT family transport system substrate-binding protein